MNIDHVDSVSIPDWAICALEYDDYSGLTDQEAEQVKAFVKDYPAGRFFWHWEMTPHFSQSPAFGLPCECVDLLIYEMTEETKV
jgi:hypothetical protein